MKYNIQYSHIDLEPYFDYDLNGNSRDSILTKLSGMVDRLYKNVPDSARCIHFTAHGSFSLSWEQPESAKEKEERLLDEQRQKQYEISEMFRLMKKHPLEAKAGF